MATEVLQQIPPSQYQVKIFSAGDEIKQLLRAQRPTVNRRAIDYHSAALRHVKVNEVEYISDGYYFICDTG